MEYKVIFFVFTLFAAVVLAGLVAGGAAAVGHLAGMHGAGLVTLAGGAFVATFGAVLAVANIAAGLFFSTPEQKKP